MKKLKSNFHISHQLFRAIFSSYILIALVVTSIQMIVEYRHEKNEIVNEVSILPKTFGPELVDAIWTYDDKLLHSILVGIKEIPAVTGIKINIDNTTEGIGIIIDDEGIYSKLNNKLFIPLDEDALSSVKLIPYEFPLMHRGIDGQEELIGTGVIYTDESIFFERVQYGFFLIIINSFIKAFVLWFIFIFFVKKMLDVPITQLTNAAKNIDLTNIDNFHIVHNNNAVNELNILSNAYKDMTVAILEGRNKLDLINKDLENQVCRRTKKLTEANYKLEQEVFERKQAEEKLKYLATHDPLTGLNNRNNLNMHLNEEVKRSSRYRTPFSVFMLDIDHFKKVNDNYGHLIGDEILIFFARIIEDSIRNTDFAARYGGEEFIIILPETPIEKAEELAERLCKNIATHPFIKKDSHHIKITASIGVASFPEDANNSHDLLKAADEAMYMAKSAGRNQIKISSDFLLKSKTS